MFSDLNYLKILGFLFLSAYFSGSETAFFSIGKIQQKKLEMQHDHSSNRTLRLLNKPRQLLITILLGNTIVNVAASSIAAVITVTYAQHFWPDKQIPIWMLILSMVIMTILLVFFGEITPKLFAISHAERFAKYSGFFIELLKYIFYPIIQLLVIISKLFSIKVDHFSDAHTNFTTEDLKNLLDSKSRYHPLNDSEKKIISGIFKFTSTETKKIMVPRVDIKGVSIEESIESISEQIINSGYSRLPVYNKNIDDMVGIIYAKDIILNPDNQTIDKLLRKPIFVTENTKIQTLLNLFRARKTHMAIVVDEYGGTSGLITLEDILEELVGEIVDEYDQEIPHLNRLSENEFLASGMLNITDLNEELNLNIDADKYDNLAAFLYDKFNRVPNIEEKIEYNEQALFIIASVKGQRIESVRIILYKDEEFEF
ncbi:MAG: hemolysin family protein [Candidatus Cloacimonetes bacterium]|nr:hemolysin family protein [Candidatus Cloacimonadota bacterium]